MRFIVQFLAVLCLCFIMSQYAYAQGEHEVIHFSGLIVEGDSATGVPGAHIWIPEVMRGTISNEVGFFSMPVRVGDTIKISHVGFKTKTIVIPQVEVSRYSVLVSFLKDDKELASVVVTPFPVEEVLKEAFLSMEVPKDQRDNIKITMSKPMMDYMTYHAPTSPASHHNRFIMEQHNKLHNRGAARVIPLLNPFAWATLIMQIRNGTFKNNYRSEKPIPIIPPID